MSGPKAAPPKCLNCGKQLAKRTVSYTIRAPREGREAGFEPEGTLERGYITADLYTANPPKTKADAQRLVNGEVVSVSRSHDGSTISSFGVWEGEYESRYEFFCKNDCAARFGQRMAKRGVRL